METLITWPRLCLPDLSFVKAPPAPACPRSIFWESVTKSSPHARRGNYFHLSLNHKHVYILLQLFGNSINTYIVIQPMGSDIWLEKLPFVCHLVCVRFLLMVTELRSEGTLWSDPHEKRVSGRRRVLGLGASLSRRPDALCFLRVFPLWLLFTPVGALEVGDPAGSVFVVLVR